MQPELFKPRALELAVPAGVREPRLWVRRLTIWRAAGDLLRTVELKPGLNIVWSPDPADHGARGEHRDAVEGPGHGAGKTLFCRLLRYCLGERRFAPRAQREKIASSFPEGRVGAEVVVDSVNWAVVRSIGVLRHDVVQEGATLDALVATDSVATGMKPLVDAIIARVLGRDVADLIADDSDRAWLQTLAWLTRDQECRFGRLTEWRSAASESESPAGQLSARSATRVIRALLGSVTTTENELEAAAQTLERDRQRAERDLDRRTWALEKATERAATVLGLDPGLLPPGALAIPALRARANESAVGAQSLQPDDDLLALSSLIAEYERTLGEVSRLTRELELARSHVKTAEAMAAQLEAETWTVTAELAGAAAPPCPICEVPIDRALAEGCGLSHKLPDFAALQKRRNANKQELAAQRSRAQLETERAAERLKELKVANDALTRARQRVDAACRLRDERVEDWYRERRLHDQLNDLADLLRANEHAAHNLEETSLALDAKRDEATAARRGHAALFARLEALFDPLVREILGDGATGGIHLDGTGIRLTVEYGGDRSTPAIDTVKIIAFDIAAICRAIEGGAPLPPFLIHDSPREADLGLSVYHQLFRAARRLEELGESLLFQYIITTTTKPPEDVCTDPWLRLILKGSPAEERLLRCNL